MGKTAKGPRHEQQTRGEEPLIPPRYQNAAAVAVIVLSMVVFFHPLVFQGKTFVGPDTIAAHSFEPLLKEADQQGIFPLWNPYIFCGMPGYASLTFSGARPFDFVTAVGDKIRASLAVLFVDSELGRYLVYYLVLGIGMYFFALHRLKQKIASLVVALGSMYAFYMIILVTIGHVTKIGVVAWFPLAFLLVEKTREQFRLWYLLLLALCLRFMIAPGHVQYIFYLYLAFACYFLFFFVRALLKKEVGGNILRAGGVFTAATVLALFMGADQYLSILEYTPYSIRGSSPLVKTSAENPQTVAGGLDYEYATNWSLGPGEVVTFFLPSWYGFGPQTYQGVLSQNRPVRVNTYWGPQPGVDGPHYFGVVVLIFAIVGFVHNRKDPFVQYLTAMILFALLVAFGKEFSLVYDLMYRYFPLFNKFRVPLMIVVLLQVMIPLLAGYGVVSLWKTESADSLRQSQKRLRYGLFALGGLLVLSFLGRGMLRPIYESFFPPEKVGQVLAHSPQGLQPAVLQELYSFVFSSVMSDLAIACVLLLVVLGAFYLFRQGKVSVSLLSALLVAAIVFDLWRVAYKAMEPQERRETQQLFAAPDHVKFLQQDKGHFRVLEFVNGQPPYNNMLAYWGIQSAYGYQGAKMRAYQDVVDVVGLQNPLLWNLMNVKYLISNQPDTLAPLLLVYNGKEMKVYHNTAVLPRAFFVNRYEVAGRKEILDKIARQKFNPQEVAYMMEDPKLAIDAPRVGSAVEVRSYGIQSISMNVTATGNNLLFLSETYYPEGWKALVDGQEIPIYRLNYLFRGVVVPPGTHTVEMKFEPRGFSVGKNLSLAANVLLVSGLLSVGLQHVRRRKSRVNVEPH